MSISTASPRLASSSVIVWITLGLVILADAMDLIDSTVTNIAVPTIATEIGGGETLVKWVGAAYTLALGALLVVGARIGDRYGQRRTFLIGLAGFTLSSLACGIAPDPELLIAARIVQGAFGALLIPQGIAIMVRSFPKDALRTAFSIFAPLLGIATVGGPVLAGFIITANIAGLSWRPIFLINVVIGVVGLIVGLTFLPSTPGDKNVKIDGLGALLLGIAIFGIMLGLTTGPDNSWQPWTVTAIVVGVLFFALFVWRQRTSSDPLLKPALFRNRGFVSGLIVGVVFFGATTGLVFVLSLFLQQTLHATPLETSLTLLPMTFGIIAASFAGMGLLKNHGRQLVIAGFSIVVAAGLWLFFVVLTGDESMTGWSLAIPVFFIGAGMGFGFASIFNTALGNIADDEAGSASGSMEAVQQLAGGMGSALVATLYLGLANPVTFAPMLVTLAVVIGLIVISSPLIALMPATAFDEEH